MSNAMADDGGFADILSQRIETYLKNNGPSKLEQISHYLYDMKEVYVVISGSMTKLPDAEIEAVLETYDEFTRDSSGRWHLTKSVS